MPAPPLEPDPIFIIAGTSQQYSEARRKLDPSPFKLYGLLALACCGGSVYRHGDCKALLKLQEIETALQAVAAEDRPITYTAARAPTNGAERKGKLMLGGQSGKPDLHCFPPAHPIAHTKFDLLPHH